MCSLILCHEKKARQPYEITRIHKKIYTIEELCYYICNNPYLIDYTLVNKELCNWISEELAMEELAAELKSSLRRHGSMEQFVMMILKASVIYTGKELTRVEDVLQQLKNLKDVERQKYKADNLLESGEMETAILGYLSIIHGEHDETVDSGFYGRVYGCLGAAYGRLFLYEEAAKNYEAAFQICEEESMLYGYINCSRQYMTEEQYRVLLSKSEIYREINALIEEEIHSIQDRAFVPDGQKALAEYQHQYRRQI